MAETPERVLVYDRVDANRRNTLLLLGLLALVSLPGAGYMAAYLAFLAAVLAFSAGWEAAVAAGGVIAVGIVLAADYLAYRYSSALVLRLAGAREVERDEEPDLFRTVESLCIGAGLPQPRMHVVDSAAANAFATGLKPENASLVVTRGLLALLERRELEGVVAHELSHIGNHDIRLSTILAASVALLRLPFSILFGFFRFLFRLHWMVGAGALLYLGLPLLAGIAFLLSLLSSEPGAAFMLLFAMAVPAFVVLGAPVVGLLIARALSREREFLADADAVLLTRDAEPLATALAKIGGAGGAQTKVTGATVHLYFVEPLAVDAPWWDRVFSTHPPIEERIALLADMGDGIPPSALREAVEAGVRFRTAGTRLTVPEAGQLRAQPPARDDKSWVGVTEPGDVKRAPVAFCLGEVGATLYAGPDAGSVQLAQLPSGAFITVLETAGDFLRVITSDDSFGFIPRTTEMSEVDLKAGHGRR